MLVLGSTLFIPIYTCLRTSSCYTLSQEKGPIKSPDTLKNIWQAHRLCMPVSLLYMLSFSHRLIQTGPVVNIYTWWENWITSTSSKLWKMTVNYLQKDELTNFNRMPGLRLSNCDRSYLAIIFLIKGPVKQKLVASSIRFFCCLGTKRFSSSNT